MRPAALFLLLLLPGAARAQALPDLPDLGDLPPPARYLAGYLSAGFGWSRPFGGHWGDSDDGFRSSPALSLAASKRVDELLSYGAETVYCGGYRSKGVDGLQLKTLSLSPFLKVSFPEGNAIYYGQLGAGVYQWRQTGYYSGAARVASDSGSNFGMSLGGGASWPFIAGTRLALDLRWHRLFSLKSAAIDLGSADSFNTMFTVTYGFWKSRKAPLTSQ